MPITLPIVVARPASVVRRSAVRNVEDIELTVAEEIGAVKFDINNEYTINKVRLRSVAYASGVCVRTALLLRFCCEQSKVFTLYTRCAVAHIHNSALAILRKHSTCF